jgi:N-dimethylarginine dimethylaminohydrolase
MTAPLRRVFVRRPGALDRWREYGWRAAPDPARIADEHERLCELLASAGADVVVGEPLDGNPDSVYVYDPALVVDGEAVVLRPGKEGRRAETAAAARDLEAAGVPIRAELPPDALAEGGDLIRLDERTLLAGRGYRTNAEGIAALERVTGLETVALDLPHWRGPGEVMHLLSLVSPLADDLVVAYPPLLPVRLAQLLAERGVRVVEVPDEEFETMGPNVLALAPRVALMLERNRETRRRLEAAGVDVLVYRGDELSKGDGGPTCLTCPLARG